MKTEKIVTIICVIIMFAIGIGTLATDNKNEMFSSEENRMLKGIPQLSLDNIVSGDFSSDFEKYMIDRIPLRKQIINIQNNISQSMSIVTLDDAMNLIDTESTQQMENLEEELTVIVTPTPHKPTNFNENTAIPEIISTLEIQAESTATPDANKFNNRHKRIGFTQSTADTITNMVYYNTSDVVDYANTLRNLSSMLPSDGNLVHINVLESKKARPMISAIGEGNDVTIIDETVEVLEYYTPDNAFIISSTLIIEEPLENSEQMYFFTDPHWSVEGAYYVYSETMHTLGITPYKWDNYNITYEYPFRGAYYKKAQTNYYVENPDTLTILSLPQADSFTHYLGEDNIETLPIIKNDAVDDDRYRVYFNGPQFVGPLSTIETTSDTKRNALVILDSYGLSFSTMLIPHYDTICLMDLRYMYKSTDKYYISDIVSEYEVDDIYVVVGDLNTYGTFYHKLINQYLYSK